MKVSALCALLVLGTASAFCPTSLGPKASSSKLSATFELVAEPEGGTEIFPVSTLAGSRMKQMGEAEGLTGVREGAEDEETIYKYWLQAKVEGSLVKEIHATVLKESAKKANFPGFRKGQVPPFAMPQIRGFAVEESIVQTCKAAVEAYGLKSVAGEDGSVEILEDVPEMAKVYKLGDDLEFTATLNCQIDPDVARPSEEDSDSDDSASDEAIDVEAVAE